MTKSNLDLARECGADVTIRFDEAAFGIEFTPAQLDAFADRIRADEVAEAKRLRKDAERYRKLRALHWNESNLFVVAGLRTQVRLGTDCPSLGRLDEMLDEINVHTSDTEGGSCD